MSNSISRIGSNGAGSINGNAHSIRSSKQVSEEAIRRFLEQKSSVLSEYSEQISQSPYAATIIAICTIEEYNCKVNPYGSNNLWGLMSGGHLIRFDSLDDGIKAIDNFLGKAESSGRTTIESFKGWYCQSECTSWQEVVIKTKNELENLQ